MSARLWVALCALTAVACSRAEPDPTLDVPDFEPCTAPSAAAGLVTTRDGNFELAGKVIEPHGVNSYPLLQLAGEERWDDVRDILGQAVALGRPLVRTNAFFDGTEHPARLRNDDGSLHEQGLVALDRLLAEARSFDVRLLLVLTNNWPDYGGAEAVLQAVAPGEDLKKDAFWSDPRAIEAQVAYEQALVTRRNTVTGAKYGDDATIFAWELANEPRCSEPSLCDDRTLVRWAIEMAGALTRSGARQLIAWGGSGYTDRYGEDLDAIASEAGVGILTLHLYPDDTQLELDGLDRDARVTRAVRHGAARIEQALEIAERHGLPLLLEELGYSPRSSGAAGDEERALVFGDLLAFAHARKLATLPWMLGEREREDYDGYLIRPTDEATSALLECR